MKDREEQLFIVELSTAEDTIKREAIRVFVDSFYELYTSLSKEKSVLNEFFISSFDEKLVYAAVKENKVLGILAIANEKERSLKFNKEIETNLGMRYQDNATNKLVIWKSTNTRIATVNQIDISNWSNQNGSKEGKEMSLS